MLQLCIILLVVGLLALVLEIIMPGYDGFIGAVVGVLALIASAILAVVFVPHGWIFVAVNLSVLAVCVYFAMMYIKRQQLNGKLILSEALADDLPGLDYEGLVGKEGKTVTALRPSGEVDFNGTRVEVTTGGTMVNRGALVKVVEASTGRVVVSVVNGN